MKKSKKSKGNRCPANSWRPIVKTEQNQPTFVVTEQDAGRRLDLFLKDILTHSWQQDISRAQIKLLLDYGCIRLNKNIVRVASKPIFAGAKIKVGANLAQVQTWSANPARQLLELSTNDILFEDKYLVLINKPANVPTQATLDPSRDHLFAAVQRYIQKCEPFRHPYVGLHHRLDRDTSGIVLMTKKKVVNKAVADLFSNRKITKTYSAIISFRPSSAPPEAWEIKNHLAKIGSPHFKIQSVHSGGQWAHTKFKLEKAFYFSSELAFALIEAQPQTGRTHQIRVHLAEAGWPIVGDPFYGTNLTTHETATKLLNAERTLLHAMRLRFQHPIDETVMEISAPVPPDFKDALAYLEGSADSKGN